LDSKLKSGATIFDIQIAGNDYQIDVENWKQINKNNPKKCRQIARKIPINVPNLIVTSANVSQQKIQQRRNSSTDSSKTALQSEQQQQTSAANVNSDFLTKLKEVFSHKFYNSEICLQDIIVIAAIFVFFCSMMKTWPIIGAAISVIFWVIYRT